MGGGGGGGREGGGGRTEEVGEGEGGKARDEKADINTFLYFTEKIPLK